MEYTFTPVKYDIVEIRNICIYIKLHYFRKVIVPDKIPHTIILLTILFVFAIYYYLSYVIVVCVFVVVKIYLLLVLNCYMVSKLILRMGILSLKRVNIYYQENLM